MSLYPVGQFPAYRPRRLRQVPALRDLVRQTQLNAAQLVLPLFVRAGRKLRSPIAAMPGVFQLSPDELVREATRAHEVGVPAVLLLTLWALPSSPEDESDLLSESAAAPIRPPRSSRPKRATPRANVPGPRDRARACQRAPLDMVTSTVTRRVPHVNVLWIG